MTLEKLSKKLKKRFAGFIDTTEIRPPVIFDGFSSILFSIQLTDST